ncbi:AmmeMemoRadiSam system protein A [Luedemannella helvata]|uniref:AmmeMemoRadiSam system protein A n=1 Tax=Luedemannella helvata TaxID=349315 RepID=A0ABP4X9T1_9ACTN
MNGHARGSRPSAPADAPATDGGISAAEGQHLATRAARAIGRALTGAPRDGRPPTSAALRRLGASFVTLHRDGELRGCIGTLAPVCPLYLDVTANALRAMRDPRLPPVTARDWPRLDVGVSVLGPLVPLPVTDLPALVATLRPGVDGLVITADGRQATFLPVVWDKLTDPAAFVGHLLAKGGWPAGRLPEGAVITRYTAPEFHDLSPRPPLT